MLSTSAGLHVYFYALTARFGHWLAGDPRGRNIRQWQVAAGLFYGQVKKKLSFSHENEEANVWHNVTSSALQLWQLEELTGTGPCGRCCTIPCHRCHASQFERECA